MKYSDLNPHIESYELVREKFDICPFHKYK